MRRLLIMVAAVAMLVVMAVPAQAQDDGPPDFVVYMTGDQEVGGGDPNGFGVARLDFSRDDLEVCFVIDLFRVSRPITGIHIHDGDVGTNGPIVIDFDFATNGFEGCVDVERSVLREILRDPAGFYVNVHNADYPDGAVRGQLA